jgi:hypothetical protein
MGNQAINTRIFLILFLLISIGVSPLLSNTILFRDGTKLRGEVVGQDQATLNVKMPDGEMKTISKDTVLKVYFKDFLTPAEEAAIRQKELLAEKKQEEYADILSKSITPLPQESAELKEEELIIPSETVSRTTAQGAFFRSLILPGWGQFYQGRPLAGSFYSIMAIGGSYALYEKNRIYRNASKDLSNLENPFTEGQVLGSFLGFNELPAQQELEKRFLFGGAENPVDIIYQLEYSPQALQRRAVDRHLQERENLTMGLAAFWIWNAFDALIFHPKNNEPVLGFQENLDRGNWTVGFDSKTIHANNGSIMSNGWNSVPSIEHRFVFSMNF